MKLPALLILFVLNFTSCATIFSGSKSIIHIRTDPPAANISITDRHGNEVYSGSKQAIVKLKSGGGYFTPARYTVKINNPGYQEKVIEIRSSINGWYFANIFIGGAIGMLIIDPATGAMWKLKDIMIDEKLEKLDATTSVNLQITDIRDLPYSQKNELVRIH